MQLDFDIRRIATTEFGIGRGKPLVFVFVPVDRSVQSPLRQMVHRTLSSMEPMVRQASEYYQPSEKYASQEYCYLDLFDPMAQLFRDVALANNLHTDTRFPSRLRDLTCYFVRLTDHQGRRLTAFRRAAYFKGVCKKKLVHWIDNTLRLVPDTVFKLDEDFDLIVDSRAAHVLRPKSMEALGDLKKSILGAVPENIATIGKEMPFVAFASVRSYAETRIRAARYLTSIRQHNLRDIDMDALEQLCVSTGVRVEKVNGRISVPGDEVMGFLEVLDRRRYGVELVRESPEFYRAASRQKVGVR